MPNVRIVHDKDHLFVQLSTLVLRDPNISLAAKGLWANLLSRPNDWNASVTELVQSCGCGKTKIYCLLDELVRNGYAYRFQPREKGRFNRYDTYVFESKKTKEEIQIICPHSGFPEAEKPQAEKTDTKNIEKEKNIDIKEHSLVPDKSGTKKTSPEIEELKKIFYDELKKAKPDYAAIPGKNWDDICKKLLKIRTKEQILERLRWCLSEDNFWKKVVQSPNGLLNNLDKIEVEMAQKPSENSVKEIFERHARQARDREIIPSPGRMAIQACSTYVEFSNGPYSKRVEYNLPEAEWQQQTGWYNENKSI